MNYTENYNLGLPLPAEKYDVTIFNSNNSVIDGQMKINSDTITSHVSNKSNPHEVTAEQVGLGSVDNTADAAKPVSAPQAQYIAAAVAEETTRATTAEGVNAAAITALQNAMPGLATLVTAGLVKPDGITILVDNDGTIHGAVQITVDSALDNTSVNPVQNKVIADAIADINTALNGKQATLTFDATPTSGSTNPVESGGIYTSLSEKADSATTYTKTEVDNLISTLEAGNDWKEAVATFSDIATTYPNPQDGWTVNVKDTDYTYRYDGTDWVVISANAIPNATTSVNGLMTTSQVTDLNANTSARHTHSNKSVLDDTTASFTTALETKLNGISDSADAVSFTQTLSSGTEVGKITINGTDVTLYAPTPPSPGSTVTFSQTQTSGTEVGKITIDGTATSLYAPTPITADATTSAHGLMSTTDKVRANYTNIAYATCSTAGSSQIKIATVVSNTAWTREVGAIVGVLYTNTNTYSATSASPCLLNVNSSGAANIYYDNSSTPTGVNTNAFGSASRMTYYMYNGTYWMYMGMGNDNDTTYTPYSLGFGYGTCGTSASTPAKVVTMSNYERVNGGIIAVKFTYAVPAGATLNVNNSGANSIYYHGSAIKAGVLNANDLGVFVFDGTYYHLIAKDSASVPYVTGTISAGVTSITLSNSNITSSSTIDGPYTDAAGVTGYITSITSGSVTCSISGHTTSTVVKCYIRND